MLQAKDIVERLMVLMTADWDPEEIDRRVLIDQNRRTLIGQALRAEPRSREP